MRSLLSNKSGAVMVMSAFFSIFLVAILYHVIGVGGAALEQQILQDAADAAVFSAATVNARGMNILVMINLLMVAALAVLVTLRLIEALLTIAVGVFTALCVIPYTSYIGCPVAPNLNTARAEIAEITDIVDEVIGPLLEGLTSAADAVNEVVPYLAEAEGIYISLQDEYKPTEGGFVWPIFEELPTMEGEFKTLCERAGVRVGELIFLALPMKGKAKDTMCDLIGGLVSTFSNYFCGGDDDSGGGSSSASSESSGRDSGEKKTKSFGSKDLNQSYPAVDHDECAPHDPEKKSCDTCPSGDGDCEHNGDIASATCDCAGNESCVDCSRKGCDYCWGNIAEIANGLWTIRRDRWKEYWKWDKETGTGTWRFKEWVEEDRRWLRQEDGNPCKDSTVIGDCNDGSSVSLREQQNLEAGDDPPEAPPAICTVEEEVDRGGDSKRRALREVERVSYLYLHSCEIPITEEIVTSGQPVEDNGKKYPRELDPETYPTDSKMRSILIGGGKSSKRMKGANLAAKKPEDGAFGQRFSVAAAEYYSPNDDMWHLNWTARLIRFRLSYDESESGEGGDSGGGASGDFGGGSFDTGCMQGFFDGECDQINSKLGSGIGSSFDLGELGGDIEDLIAH